MKNSIISYFKNSVILVGANISFIFILAFAEMNIYSNVYVFIPVLQLILLIAVYPLCFIKIYETCSKRSEMKLTNFINYWIVLSCAFVVMATLSKFIHFDRQAIAVFSNKFVIPFIFSIFFIYTVPIILINKISLTAIPPGLKCLFKNLKKTISLIILSLIVTCFKFLPIIFLYSGFIKGKPVVNTFIFDVFNYACFFAGIYLNLIVFSIALFILNENRGIRLTPVESMSRRNTGLIDHRQPQPVEVVGVNRIGLNENLEISKE